MSSIDRVLRADALHFDLAEEEREATHPDTLERDGRSSRTLLKEGPLRVTLIVLGPGGGIPEHEAQNPITLQALHGAVDVRVGEDTYRLVPGELLAIDGNVTHHISSDDGAAFLLTVTHP
ncbi:MAG: hypothetical protein ACOC5I_01600 [Gemmatimonadota bacterium]